MKIDAATKKWLKANVDANAPAMESSTAFVSIFTKDYYKDPSCALQIGLAVLMDKPIIIIADERETVPLHLVKIARVIERINIDDPKAMQRASLSIGRVAEEIKKEAERGRSQT